MQQTFFAIDRISLTYTVGSYLCNPRTITMPYSFLFTTTLLLLIGYGSLNLIVLWAYPRQLFPYRGSTYDSLPGLSSTQSSTGEKVAWIYQPASDADAPVLLYFHGNGEDLGTNTERFAWFNELGYSVIALDYPGYGQSSGSPTAENVRAAANAVWEEAQERYGVHAQDTVVWGRSLGGAPAIFIASQHPFRGLVLEATFRSVLSMVPLPFPLLLTEPFPSEDLIASVEGPIFLFHGELDRTIPATHSQRLAEANSGTTLYLYPDGSHNDLRHIGRADMQATLAKLRITPPDPLLSPAQTTGE